MLLLNILAFHGLPKHALSVLGKSLLLEILQKLLKGLKIRVEIRRDVTLRSKNATIPENPTDF